MLQVAIILGYTNLNIVTLCQQMAAWQSEQKFHVETHYFRLRDVIRPYDKGVVIAEELATVAALQYKTPICIGVSTIRQKPQNRSFKPALVDIAVIIENSQLCEPLYLTPRTSHNAMVAGRQHETKYDAEGCRTLVENIRVRQRALNLV